ncbi:MAG: 16S rRNA (uracil(1498)-N(3))-methyltransferase [Betaproteobacteria bacterium]
MNPRLFSEAPSAPAWRAGETFALPPTAARHVQVLRLQPGSALTLFNGSGGQWQAEVLRMGRHEVEVRLLRHEAVERELPLAVTLAIGMPANDRMDDLVEKATELGAAAIVPLVSERSVLRLSGERAAKRQAHWQAVAVAASEQCGRNRVMQVLAVQGLEAFLADDQAPNGGGGTRWQLSLAAQALPLGQACGGSSRMSLEEVGAHICLLSGPEGGLSLGEQARAQQAGYAPVSLGPRTLRADTAPLGALAVIGACMAPPKDLR